MGLVIVCLLVAWAAWSFFGQVTVCEVTDSARLEVTSQAHCVAAQVAGRVVQTRLTIGREVTAGEALVLLDAEAERRAIEERQAKRKALDKRLQAFRAEIEAERQALLAQRQEGKTAVEEARARGVEAEARLKFARQQSDRLMGLRARNAAAGTDEDLQRALAEVEAGQAAVKVLSLLSTRLEQERAVQESDRKTRIAKLEREAAELEGDSAIEAAAIRRFEHEIDIRIIRAPVSGRVGEAAELQVGSVVQAAEKLGCIVPPGEPRAVAFFPVAGAGRIRPGQPARLRLHGYPWTQYGTIAATVTDVANEPSAGRAGQIRVEFALIPDADSLIPREHGLPASAEVAVEQLSPARLLLRAAGQFLTTQRSPPPSSVNQP